jgi:hypothetical protein
MNILSERRHRINELEIPHLKKGRENQFNGKGSNKVAASKDENGAIIQVLYPKTAPFLEGDAV